MGGTESQGLSAAAEPEDERGARLPFAVVGVGASAGGLEALGALVRRLGPDGMAYVVVQHLAPDHDSLLVELLARDAALPVVAAVDGARVERDTIYVAPPGVELTLAGQALRAVRIPDAAPRHTIDAFLRSLANAAGVRAVGVVLSGTGNDGTMGLRVIKEHGGITFAQQPGSAGHPEMPRSAVDAGVADFVLTPEEIGDELARLGRHPYVASRAAALGLDRDLQARLLERLRRGFGVDFAAYKPATIERRVARRMALHNVDRLADYLTLVEASDAELGQLYGDLLIGVTGFFRDREPFEVLGTAVFPRLLESRAAEEGMRVWVPGCSTGEEAYSIAICLLEYLGDRAAGFRAQIFGTDVDEEALTQARLGWYPASIELDVSAARLERFFRRDGDGYRVARHVRDMVVFAHHNLGKDPPFSRLDLISCRNVLIYFQPALQAKVLRVFHYALNPDSCLLLGRSESVGEASNLFSLVDRVNRVYVKKNTPSAAVFDVGLGARAGAPATAPLLLPSAVAERRPAVSVQQQADRKVLQKYGPPGMLLDDRLDVVQFRGDTGRFLSPAPGSATLSALKLVRPELLVELRAALDQVAASGQPAVSAAVPLLGEPRGRVTIEVHPLESAAAHRTFFLVLFGAAPEPGGAASPAPGATTARVDELERQLLASRDYTQTVVHDFEAANEQLQSANEELLSSNEELQSLNEELQTSKEELQSTNEELATLNEELQRQMTQQAASKEDLAVLLGRLGHAVALVDPEVRIRRVSSVAAALLGSGAAEPGHPLAGLLGARDPAALSAGLAAAVAAGADLDLEVRRADGQQWTLRLRAGGSGGAGGAGGAGGEGAPATALVEIVTSADPAAALGAATAALLALLPQPAFALDAERRIVWANARCVAAGGLAASPVGQRLDEAWPSLADQASAARALEALAVHGEAFAAVPVMRPFGRAEPAAGPALALTMSGRRLPGDRERPAMCVVILEEGGLER